MLDFNFVMLDHKKKFFEILEELDISSSTRSDLIDQVYKINFDINRGQDDLNFNKNHDLYKGYCRVEIIVEEKFIADVKNNLKELRKKKLISTLNRKFLCKKTKFLITKKETYNLALEKINKSREEAKRDLDQKNHKEREERILDQMDLERLAAAPYWQERIKKNKKIKEGYIYILSNLELPRTYKIGFVKEDPEYRAKQLKSETGLDRDFVIENLWWTKNPYKVEQKIFNSLQMQKNKDGEYYGKSYRVIKELNGKSFTEFVNGESLKFFCERIEKFIQD